MKKISKTWIGRNVVRAVSVLLCVVLVIQLLGLGEIALSASLSQYYFRGYNEENIVSGFGNTFSCSGFAWDDSNVSLSLGAGAEGLAMGFISLEDEGHAIFTSVDLGTLEIDFSAETTVSDPDGEIYAVIDYCTSEHEDLISSTEITRLGSSGSETITSHASIPINTRYIIIRIVGNNLSGETPVTVSNISFKINDSQAPACSVDYDSDWTNTLPVQVNVTASDEDSGLEGIYINDEKFTASPQNLEINANTTMVIYAKDYAGHESEHQTISITNIDQTVPSAPSGVTLSYDDWTNDDVIVNLPALGESSGAPEYYAYKLHDGDPWQEVPETGLTVTESGQYDLSVAVADRAGNMSSAYTDAILIDKLPPVIDEISSEVSSGSCTVTADITDSGGSTLTQTKYELGEHDAANFVENGTVFTDNTFSISMGGTYTIFARDGAGNTALNTCVLNTAPTLIAIDSFTMNEDDTETLTLNVTDQETLLADLTVAAESSNTTLIPEVFVDRTGAEIKLVISPADDLFSVDPVTITVRVTDLSGGVTTDTFNVTVNSENDAPVALDDTGYTVEEDGNIRIDVLANDSDVDTGDVLAISNPGTPAHGTAAVVTGKIKYTPSADYSGDDSFIYTVSDGNGGTDTAQVTITVTAVNDAPTAVNDTVTTNEDNDAVIEVLTNDTDPDTGDTKALVSATDGTKGMTTVDIADGTVTYVPGENEYGQDSFTYIMQDGNGLKSTATVTVTISPVVDPPWFENVADDYTIFEDDEDYLISFDIFDVANETPADSLMLQAVSSNQTLLANKDIIVTGLGDDESDVQISLTPKANKNGQTTITLSLGDGFNTVTKEFTLFVTSVNDLPVANQDTVYLDEGETELLINIADLLANDTDIENGKPTFDGIASQPEEGHGTVVVDGTQIRYTPGEIIENTSFTYYVWDGVDQTVGTCRILVNALNRAPMLTFGFTEASTDEDIQSGALPFTISDDQTAVTDLILSTWSSDMTMVKLSDIVLQRDDEGNCTLQITPQPDANGIVSIHVLVSDGMESVEKSFTLTVDEVNDAPVAVNDTAYVPMSGSQTFDVIANDIDVDDDTLSTSFEGVSEGTYAGTLTCSDNRRFTYVAAPGESGMKTFKYVVSDGTLTSTGTVTMYIEDAKYTPEISVIANQYINEDTSSNAIHFTVTDRDVENTVAVTAYSSNDTLLPEETANINLTHNEDGTYSLVLTPVADKYGSATVTIRAEDNTGLWDTRSFVLTVMAVNDAPHAVDDSFTVNEDTPIDDLNLLANDSDIEEDTIWVSSISAPVFGQITKSGNIYTYTPYRNRNGIENLTYTVTDGKDTAQADLVINVTAVNDQPVTRTDYCTLPNNDAETALINVIGNDYDIENDALKVISFTNPRHGTVSIEDGKIRYTRTGASGEANGADDFTYTIIDRSSVETEGCQSATGTVKIGIHFTSEVYCDNTYQETTEDGESISFSLPFSNPNVVPVAVTITDTTLGSFTGSGQDWTFTPAANMHGEEVPILYTVTEQTSSEPGAVDGDSNSDGHVEEDSAYIILSVHSVNDPPVIDTVKGEAVVTGIHTTETFGEDSEGVSFDVAFSDVDTDDVLKFYAYTYESHTDAPVALDLDVDYTQENGVAHVSVHPLYENSNGTIKLMLGVSDGIDEDTHVIDVTVNPIDDAPVLEQDISRTLYEDTSTSVTIITPNTDVDGNTAFDTAITAEPIYGTASFTDGVITYTPDPNWSGTDTVSYTVTDQTEDHLSSSEIATFVVLPVNDPLSISGLKYYNTTNEDVSIEVPLKVTDLDDDMSLEGRYTITSSNQDVVENGGISVGYLSYDDETGEYSMKLTIDPVANASGVAYIHIVAADGRTTEDKLTATADFRLDVIPVNDAPIAGDKTVEVTETSGVTGTPGTTSVDINLVDVISDVEDGKPTITAVSAPIEGRVQNNHNNTLTYIVQGDYNGTQTFDYTVRDKNGAENVGTVTVRVLAANDAPLALDDTTETNEDTLVTVNVLENDSDIDENDLIVIGTSAVTTGATAAVSMDGKSINYTPALNFNGTDTFEYTISDGHEGTDMAIVTIEVSPDNDAPSISKFPNADAVWEMDEDIAKAFDFTVSDPETTDTSKLIITITSLTQEKLKTAGISLSSVSEHKALTVTPEENVNGSMWVRFEVTDGELTTTVDYEITIRAVNDAPEIETTSVITPEDTAVSSVVTATDIDSATLTFTKASNPAHGTVTVNPNGTFTYTPALNYTGTDSFTVQVSDGADVNNTSTGTVSVTVTPVNDNPTAVNDESHINEDNEIDINVMENDIEHDIKDGDTLTITSFYGASHGTLSLVTGEGQPDKIKYRPDANWNGTDTFTYWIEDSEEKSSSATVTVTVNPVNDVPANGNDTATMSEDDVIEILVTVNDDIDETTNAADEDVTVVEGSIVGPTNGTAVLLADHKTIKYEPADDYFGSDSFTYTAKDSLNETAVFTVAVTVNPVNDAPTISDTSDIEIAEDGTAGPLTVTVTDVDKPDSDLVVTVTRGNTNLLPAVISVTNTGEPGTQVSERTFSLMPYANKNGTSLITVTVTDGELSATDTFTLTVTAQNDKPVIAHDSDTTNENTSILIDVLANDDIDLQNEGDASLHIESVSALSPSRGTAVIDTTGIRDRIRFTPDSNMFETSNLEVTFSYVAQDSWGADFAKTSTVTVTVTPVNDAPTISSIDDVVINEDFDTGDIAFSVHDEEDADDSLIVTYTCTDTTLFPEGSITFANLSNGDRTVKAIPVDNGYGVADITLTVRDLSTPSESATETFRITVNSVNDEPTTEGNDSYTVTEDVPMQLNVLNNDDVDFLSDPSKASVTGITVDPGHGTATVAEDGKSITYVTGQDRTDTDTFTYSMIDNTSGLSCTFTVTVSVTAVNDAPKIHLVDDTNADPLDDPTMPQYTVNEGQARDGIAFTITDVDNEVGTLTLTKRSSNPVLVMSSGMVLDDTDTDSDRTINVTPNGKWNGTTYITLTVSDGALNASTKFRFIVNSVNEAPTANSDIAQIDEDATTKISVLTNDTDPDLLTTSDELFVVSATCSDTNLTVGVSSDDKGVDVTPLTNYNGGPITVNYTMRDDEGVNDSSTITVTVRQVNDTPTAVNDTGTTTTEEAPVTIDVLANDTDIDTNTELNAEPDAEKLHISHVATPTNGTAAIQTVDGYDRIVYTPKLDFNGDETFQYTVMDESGATATAQVSVAVFQVNDNPDAVMDEVSTDEDVELVITPLDNDTDVDTSSTLNKTPDSKTTFTITGATLANTYSGSVAVAGDGKSMTYTPVANNHDDNVITYTISDGHGGSDEGTVEVTVVSVNDLPVISTPANMELTEDSDNGQSAFTVSDIETSSADLTVQVFSSSIGSLVGIDDVTFSGSDSDRNVIVNPKDNQNDTTGTTITLRVTDADGGTADCTFVVTVAPVNDAPLAQDATHTIDEDIKNYAIDWTTLTSDVDAVTNGDTLSAISVSAASHGTALISGSNLIYTPTDHYNGDDSFTYTVEDDGLATATATITIHVTQVNDIPVVTGESVSMNEDGSLDIDVLANDTDIDTDTALNHPVDEALTISSIDTVEHGTATQVYDADLGRNVIKFDPDGDFNGSVSFDYYISDGIASPVRGTVSVTIAQVNDSPMPEDDTAAVCEGSSVDIDVLVNDTDIDTDGLLNADPHSEDTFAIAKDGEGNDKIAFVGTPHGNISVVDGKLHYTAPSENWFGDVEISYTMTDGHGAEAMATATVTVSAVNDPPVFDTLSENLSIAEDGDDSFTLTVSDEETAAENLSVQVASSSDAELIATGDVSIASGAGGQRTVTVTPQANQHGGPVTIRLVVEDADHATNITPYEFEVTVMSVNDKPKADDTDVTTAEETASVIDVTALISDNDLATDPGETLTVSVAEADKPSDGTISVAGNRITYMPKLNWNGEDSFSYTVTDASGAWDKGVISVTVTQVNDAPVAQDDLDVSVTEDIPVTINVLGNDSDVDMDALLNASPGSEAVTVSVSGGGLTASEHGAVAIVDNKVVYTPSTNFNGTDDFEYDVSDGVLSDKGYVTVNVAQVNDNPVAMPDNTTTPEDTQVSVNVLANDTDVDTDDSCNLDDLHSESDFAVVSTAFYGDGHGTKSESGGVITFDPDAGFSGAVYIDYVMTDGHLGNATGRLTILVDSENDVPVAIDDNVTTDEDTQAVFNVLSNDTDQDVGDVLSFDGFLGDTGLMHGTISAQTNGVVTYMPEDDYHGTVYIEYGVKDMTGTTDTGTVTIVVTPVNDAPTAQDKSTTTDEDTAVDIAAAALIGDVDGDSLTVTVETSGNPSHGTVSVRGTDIRYTPVSDWNGTDSFTYTVTDPLGESNTGDVTVIVVPINDAPVAADDSADTNEDHPVFINVLYNDMDQDTKDGLNTHPEDEILTVSVGDSGLILPTHGTVELDGNQVKYTPTADFNGTDSFEYTLSDGDEEDTALVTVTIRQVNDAPIANNDTAVTNDEDMVVINVLANDTDVDTQSAINSGTIYSTQEFKVTSVGAPTNGKAVIKNNKIEYTPKDNFAGKDSFTYLMTDGHNGTAAATVTVTVNSVNDPPQIPIVHTPEEGSRYGGESSVNVTWTGFDIDGDVLTYSLEYYDGAVWHAVATGLNTTSYDFKLPSSLSSITNLQFRVNASDAQYTSGFGYSGKIAVDKNVPVNIVVNMTKADGKPYTAGTWTNQSVTVTALSVEDASAVSFKYALEDKAYTAAANITVTSGVYNVFIQAIDEFGNTSEFGGYLIKIDKLAPAVPLVNVTLSGIKAQLKFTLSADPGGSGNSYLIMPDGTQHKANSDLTWSTDKNDVYTMTIVDNVGNSTKFNVTVDSLDETPPMIDCNSGSYVIGDTTLKEITAKLKFTDDMADITAKGFAVTKQKTYSGVYQSYKENIVISQPGTYYIHAFAKNSFGLTTYQTFGPFILAAIETGQEVEPAETAVEVISGDVIVNAPDVVKNAVKIRLPDGEWQDSLTMEGVAPGTYLVEVMDENGNIQLVEVTITDEDIAFGQRMPRTDDIPLYAFAAGGIGAGLLLLWLLFKRNVRIEMIAVKENGSERVIRVIKLLRRSRKKLAIAIHDDDIKNSNYGRLTLSKGLTRHMRNNTLFVTLGSFEVFSAAIPKDAEGRFEGIIESWNN